MLYYDADYHCSCCKYTEERESKVFGGANHRRRASLAGEGESGSFDRIYLDKEMGRCGRCVTRPGHIR